MRPRIRLIRPEDKPRVDVPPPVHEDGFGAYLAGVCVTVLLFGGFMAAILKGCI